MSEKQFPSIAEQGKNLAKFTFEVVKDVVVAQDPQIYASDKQIQERLDICKTCEYYSVRQERCKHCGCWLVHKTKFKAASCPIDKW